MCFCINYPKGKCFGRNVTNSWILILLHHTNHDKEFIRKDLVITEGRNPIHSILRTPKTLPFPPDLYLLFKRLRLWIKIWSLKEIKNSGLNVLLKNTNYLIRIRIAKKSLCVNLAVFVHPLSVLLNRYWLPFPSPALFYYAQAVGERQTIFERNQHRQHMNTFLQS